MTPDERTELESIAAILDNDECQCEPGDGYVDEPPENIGDHPAEHAQYCPVYLAAWLKALLEGRQPADPDAWPDAPPFCNECGGTRGRHKSAVCAETAG